MSKKDLIITLPSTNLREKSYEVSFVTDEIRKIIDDMKAATLDWEASRPHEVGIALAAIQIDRPHRIIIVRNNFDDKKDRAFSVFINPKLTKKEGEVVEDYEGCLSVSDIYGKVPRYARVRMKATDQLGREVRVRANGFLARVIQHELDHLEGKLFVDHIKDKKDAFYKLSQEGKLIHLDYDQLQKSHIFR